MSAADYAGVWIRRVLYEPRDTVLDTSAQSLVLWIQSPCGAFIDLRSVVHEGSQRGFAGLLEVSADQLTWHRRIDSRPECCPSGVDSARGRWVAANVLLEEGDGYLEVWERLGHQLPPAVVGDSSAEVVWREVMQQPSWSLSMTFSAEVVGRLLKEQYILALGNFHSPSCSVVDALWGIDAQATCRNSGAEYSLKLVAGNGTTAERILVDVAPNVTK